MKETKARRNLRNQKAITLIALVISIVVLLILSSITITSLNGDNGIIENAIWAAFSTEMTTLDEQIAIKQIENSGKILNGESEEEIFNISVSPEALPQSLKMEIIYIRENMPENKEPTKEYYIEDLLDYLIDDTGTVKGLYRVTKEVAGNDENYIYDELTNTAFKIKATRIRGKTIHSYKYGCEVMGGGTKTELDEKQYVLAEESEIVTVNEEKYYAPNLEGFNALTTNAEYYSDDFSQIQEISISIHMNQQVLNKIVDGNTTYTWYDYSNKKWANIKKTANGYEAWWVWIPRYAYRLPDNPNDDTEIMFIDINNKPLDTAKYGNTIPEDFIIHPAFDQDTDSNGNKLSGIWVSKYKPSHVKDTSDDEEMSNVYQVPDITGFNQEESYAIKYSSDGNAIESETQLSLISDLETFNEDKKWYDYENKIWANIKTVSNEQEAWWVWIPRYAYKLPDNPNDDTEIIFVDINNKPLDTEKWSELPSGFKVHPAFDQDTDSNGNKLSGIWVSKYKPSQK